MSAPFVDWLTGYRTDLRSNVACSHEWRSGLGHKLVVQQPDVRLLDGTYNIRAKDGTSGELGLYLSVGSADSDAWVNLHDRDDGSGRQQWAVESTKVDDNLLYRLYIQRGRSQGVRSTLSCLSETDSSLVDLWFNDDGSGRQQWWLIPLGNDCYCIYVAGGREKNRFLSRRKPDERYVDLWHSSGDHQVSQTV